MTISGLSLKKSVLALGTALCATLAGLAAPSAAPFRIIITETETPLVPNSVIDLAHRLGFYKKAGVDVELVRVPATPSAVAALRTGQGDMANIATDSALQLLARDQMKLKGVTSPDKALPFIIAANKQFTDVKQLVGKSFGVSRIGSVDFLVSRSVFARLGIEPDSVKYVVIGQPPVRAQALVGGRVDATVFSIGVWLSLTDRSGINMLVDQKAYNDAAPFVTKLNVVTDTVAKDRAKEVEGVVRGIIEASRQFATDPKSWVEAMAAARPDVKRADLEDLAARYKDNWSVNGGINLEAIKFTTDTVYQDAEWQGLRKVAPSEWIDTSFADKALAALGVSNLTDPTGR